MKNYPSISYGHGYVMSEGAPDYLVGRVLTIIEALGLRETQEKSLKDLLRTEIYKLVHEDEGAVMINASLHNEIRRVVAETKPGISENVTPQGFPGNHYEFQITYRQVENQMGVVGN